MAGQSPLLATEEQRTVLDGSGPVADRGEADRARAVLLTLSGWTSPRIAEAFGVREDTVRLWRSDFMRDGCVAALKATVGRGPPPVKSEAALRVASRCWRRRSPPAELDHPLPSRRDRAYEGVASAARNCPGLPKKVPLAAGPGHVKGRQTSSEVDGRPAPAIAKQQAEAGDIILLYGDESEALTHPDRAGAWAKTGADLRVPAPG